MAIDNRTTGRNYPLPHPSNLLAEDVQRLRDALNAIDADVTQLDQLIEDVVDGAPGALDTLNELAAALGDDANFAATVTNALNNRYTKAESDARYVQGVTQTENVFTGNGSQATFTLSQTPPTRESLLVTVDGVVQPVSEYSLSGTALTLSEAPASGAKIRVLMLGVAGPVQSASTLSFTQSGTGAFTRTVESRLRDMVSVKDFGAVGDGSFNDTTAFTNAFNYSPNVYAPAGVYNVSGLTRSVWSSGGVSFVGTNGMTVRSVNDIDAPSFDLSWLVTKDGNKVVITGDSLSFNAYDFPANGNDGYTQLPGLMSWSFMLRDFIHRADPWFEHADQLDLICSNGAVIQAFNGASLYTAPFNNRYIEVVGTGTTSEAFFMKRVNNEQTNKLTLHCMSNPNPEGDCLCDVRFSLYPYTSSTLAGTLDARTGTNYQGFEPFTLDVPCGGDSNYPVKIIFTNFRLRNGGAIPSGARSFFLLAAGSKNTPVYLTGRGGWMASEVYADFTNRIGQYAPDLLIMITGANDRFYTTKENWASGMVNVINATKAIKPYCQIVCLGPMPASDSGYSPNQTRNGSTMREFLEYGKKAATEAGAIWFDNYDLFRGVDPAVWRFDNVHMTKRGNKIMFDALVGRFFSAAPGSKDYYDPLLQANPPKFFQEQKRRESGFVNFTYASTTTVYTITGLSSDPDQVVRSITRINSYTVRIEFNYNLTASLGGGPRISSVNLMHTGGSSYWIEARIYAFGSYYIDYFLIDTLSNTLLSDAMNNDQGYTLFF